MMLHSSRSALVRLAPCKTCTCTPADSATSTDHHGKNAHQAMSTTHSLSSSIHSFQPACRQCRPSNSSKTGYPTSGAIHPAVPWQPTHTLSFLPPQPHVCTAWGLIGHAYRMPAVAHALAVAGAALAGASTPLVMVGVPLKYTVEPPLATPPSREVFSQPHLPS